MKFKKYIPVRNAYLGIRHSELCPGNQSFDKWLVAAIQTHRTRFKITKQLDLKDLNQIALKSNFQIIANIYTVLDCK